MQPQQPQEPQNPVPPSAPEPAQPMQPQPTPPPTEDPVIATPPIQPASVPAAPLEQAEPPQAAFEPGQLSPDEAAIENAQGQSLQWQAPEYIEHEKTPLWFVGFWTVAIVLTLAAALLMRSWSFTILVPIMAAALMFYSHRPPRIMSYVISAKGIYINEQLHPMSEFRSFGVMQEEAIPAVVLVPTKRFRPGLIIHFPAEIGESVVDALGSRIPMKEHHPDVFDRLVRKLRI